MTPWEKYKKKLESKPKLSVDKINKTDADEETIAKRYDSCKQCEMLMSTTKQCRKCGCFMPANVKLIDFSCPLGKW